MKDSRQGKEDLLVDQSRRCHFYGFLCVDCFVESFRSLDRKAIVSV